MDTELGNDGWMETRELVHFVTQQTRFALINKMLQHPEQLLSMCELVELNPSVSDATVYKHNFIEDFVSAMVPSIVP